MRAILTWHSIDDSGSVISTPPAELRRQLVWLAESGIEVLDLESLLVSRAARAVALTFDDAFENFVTRAWPLLLELDLPATVFVPTGHVGRTNAWESGGPLPELPILQWEALARLAEAGLSLGSHSVSHPDLRRLDDATLREEIAGAAARIRSETGREARAFAYPFGAVDDRVAARVGEQHPLAVTTEFRTLDAPGNALRLPRLDAFYFKRVGRLETFGTKAFERFVDTRRRLRRARRFFTRD